MDKSDENTVGLRLKQGMEKIVLEKTNSSSDEEIWSILNSGDILQIIHKHRDPRVDDWLLMGSPWPTLGLVATYLTIIFVGPKLMVNSQAYSLKRPMLFYNFFQTIFCFVLSGIGWWYIFNGELNMICGPVDYSSSQIALLQLRLGWWYFFSKFIDFFDSFFFVLRKKNNQLSLLHIIHHSTMPLFCWFGPKFAGGGHTVFSAACNMTVHVVMYAYYFLAALGVRKEYLWWKKYLTRMQLVQFVVVLIHGCLPLFQPDCQYPKAMCYLVISNAVMYLFLFTNFYNKEYKMKTAKMD